MRMLDVDKKCSVREMQLYIPLLRPLMDGQQEGTSCPKSSGGVH